MEGGFYRDRLHLNYGLETIVPNDEDRAAVHRVIYDELVQGVINPDSRVMYLQIIDRLVERGAEAIILGCTEIMLLINQADCSVPVFDSMALHAQAAAEFSLQLSGLTDVDI